MIEFGLDYLKETLEALGACQVKWNLLNKDKKEKWGFANLLASAEIENGICTYAFAPHLRYQLYNPRVYAKLNLRLQNRFKSQYALILWEVCFDYFDADRDQGETPFILLETFRELIGIGDREYQTFKALNRDVIKPAIKEINALTDYHVEIEHKRIGRRIGELKFRITKVKQLPVQESVFPDIENLPQNLESNAITSSVKPSTLSRHSLNALRRESNLTLSVNGSLNTIPLLRRIRKAAW